MGGGRVWGHVAGVWIHNRASGIIHGWRDVAGVGTCGRVWEHVAGCGDMWHGWWQGVRACGRGLDMSTPRALVECCSYVQTAMCKLVVQAGRANWSCKLVGVEACDRVWGHVAWVVAGCGGMWQGSGYIIGHQALCMDGEMWQGWEHVVECGDMWQGVETCGMGGGGCGGMWQGLDMSTPRALVECCSYVQTAMCKLLCANCYVQTGRANWSCKLVVQTGRVNWLVSRHVTGCGDMLHGWWQGVGACGRGLDT